MKRFKVTLSRTWSEEASMIVDAKTSGEAMEFASLFQGGVEWKGKLVLETGGEPVRVKALRKKAK